MKHPVVSALVTGAPLGLGIAAAAGQSAQPRNLVFELSGAVPDSTGLVELWFSFDYDVNNPGTVSWFRLASVPATIGNPTYTYRLPWSGFSTPKPAFVTGLYFNSSTGAFRVSEVVAIQM